MSDKKPKVPDGWSVKWIGPDGTWCMVQCDTCSHGNTVTPSPPEPYHKQKAVDEQALQDEAIASTRHHADCALEKAANATRSTQ